MERTFKELPNWTLWADEVSAGCYIIKGKNSLTGANLEIPCENPKPLFKEARGIAQDRDRKNPPEGEVPINRAERTWAVTRIYWGHEMALAACNDLLLSWVETQMEVLSC